MLTIHQEKSRLIRLENRYEQAITLLKIYYRNDNNSLSKRWACGSRIIGIQTRMAVENEYFFNKEKGEIR